MRLRAGEVWCGVKRWMLAPFQRIEYKLKSIGQRFVLKTISKHSSVSVRGGDPSGAAASALLLPLLAAKRRSDAFRPPSFQAIPVDRYLLTTHPRADFFYHAPRDLAETPWILQGDYQPEVTAWICSHIACDARVLVIGGRQGYHTLSIARQLAAVGQLVVLTESSDEQEVFDLNIASHRLEEKVEVRKLGQEFLRKPDETLLECVRQFAPDMAIVDLPEAQVTDLAWLDNLGVRSILKIGPRGVSDIVAGDGKPLGTIQHKAA